MKIPKAVENLIEAFERLPGIGPKTAQRLTFYLLQVPSTETDAFANSIRELKEKTMICSICRNIGETEPCSICSDPRRDQSVICVVENALDILALERVGSFKGLYHVLGGALNPLENIGPDELFIKELMVRLEGQLSVVGGQLSDNGLSVNQLTGEQKTGEQTAENRKQKTGIREIIIATNPTMEGEATAMYLKRMIGELDKRINAVIKITRIGHGLPIGADLEYADEGTLGKALEGRREY